MAGSGKNYETTLIVRELLFETGQSTFSQSSSVCQTLIQINCVACYIYRVDPLSKYLLNFSLANLIHLEARSTVPGLFFKMPEACGIPVEPTEALGQVVLCADYASSFR